jgi:hypothetical protein
MGQKSWHLDRRTFLMGSGLFLGLPYLECMAGSRAAAPRLAPNRLCCIYFPFGIADIPERDAQAEYSWWPRGEGRTFQFNRTLRPLEPFRDDVTFFQGFEHPHVKVGGHQSADFFLTGADTRNNRNTISMDQVAASHLGRTTRAPSLVLSSEGGVGSPGLSHTMSFAQSGRAIPGLANPAEIYGNLFGAVTPAVRRQLEIDRSALDLLLESANSLQRQLGQQDRRTMDEFLASTRNLEQDVQRSQAWLDSASSQVNESELRLTARAEGSDPGSYLRVMYDLIFHAFRTDNTRVATYQTCSMRNQVSVATRWPRMLGIGADCHGLAHGARRNGQAKSRWDTFMLEQLAYFVRKLKDTREGDANLLDRTLLLYGSSNSQTHRNSNYPLILAGGRRLGFTHGQYVKNPNGRPMADILLTMLQGLGVQTRSFADSTGAMPEIRT